MILGRNKQFAVERLSPQARRLIDDGLAANVAYRAIIKSVRAIGEAIALSSLSRYHAKKWLPTRAALEETDQLHALVKDFQGNSHGEKLDETASEDSRAGLLRVVMALKPPDPLAALCQLMLADKRLSVQKQRKGARRRGTIYKILRTKRGHFAWFYRGARGAVPDEMIVVARRPRRRRVVF